MVLTNICLSVPEQTFALFKVLHHFGDGKKFKNTLHVYIPCTPVTLFSFLVRLFNHSLLISKLLLDWKLVSFGPFLAGVISGSMYYTFPLKAKIV